MVLLREETLWAAWVGDCRAVVARQLGEQLRCEDLTRDHKPELAEEAARVVAHGGRIDCVRVGAEKLPAGPLRVWAGDAAVGGPGLSMTRSLGDGLAKEIGVTAEPQLAELRVDGSLRALIVASDGVWETLSTAELGALVGSQLFGSDAQRAAREIADVAGAKWARVG